jgi:peptide/nickel transport system substrate-binding protein
MNWLRIVIPVVLLGGLGVFTFRNNAAKPPSKSFVYMLNEAPAALEPTQVNDTEGQIIAENIYEGLVRFDTKGQIEPRLATEWSTSADGLTYTFSLRPNVKFHTGRIFECRDAEYALQRALISNDGNSLAFALSELTLGFKFWSDDEKLKTTTPYSSIRRAVACNSSGQLEVRLLKPSANLLERLTNFFIFDHRFAVDNQQWSGTEPDWRNWIEKNLDESALAKTSVGTNAYRTVSLEPDRIVLTAFDDYWGGAPRFKNVIVQVVTDENSRALAIKNGDADLVELSAEQVMQLKGAPGIKLLSVPDSRTRLLVFAHDIAKPSLGSGQLDGKGIPANFFSDRNVRRGFAAAFDHKRLVDEVLSGQGQVIRKSAPASLGGIDTAVPAMSYDPALAERELRQAWGGQVWQNGFQLELWYDTGGNRNQSLAEKAAETLKLGVEALNPKFKIRLRSHTGDDYFEKTLDNRLAPILIDEYLGGWFSLEAWMDGLNHSKRGYYASIGWDASKAPFKRIDALLDQAQAAKESVAQRALYQQAARVIAEEALYILIPEPNFTLAERDSLRGLEENFNGYQLGFIEWSRLDRN